MSVHTDRVSELQSTLKTQQKELIFKLSELPPGQWKMVSDNFETQLNGRKVTLDRQGDVCLTGTREVLANSGSELYSFLVTYRRLKNKISLIKELL